MMQIRATTIIAVRHQGEVAIGGDGQVTLDKTVMKQKARKIRRMYNGKILSGFAGSTSDALTLYEKFEAKLEEYHGNLPRASVELAKEWRTDRVLRRLEALLIVADSSNMFVLSGNGDVIEPDDNVATIGSGGAYALAAARALLKHANLPAREIVRESLEITSSICIYTNRETVIEVL